jgi:UDP-2,3-diacylglucosamine hydrolase
MPRTLFISDLHLAPSTPALTAAFRRFLDGMPSDVEALYILGDLFDYWAGDDDLGDPFNAEIAGGLAELKAKNIALYLLPGNRDLLMAERFMEAARGTLLPGIHALDLYGTPTLLLHGDELCLRDEAYRRHRDMVWNPAWQAVFLALPLAERKAEIENLRRRSEAEKQGKDYALMDADPAEVEALLRTHGGSRMIHGHTHRPGRHGFEVDGRPCERWVLGSWEDGPNYLECDAGGCRAVEL